ncbi:MAG TPA: RnfH family protein [Oxalobacteraceae bacterium]|jgi:putative ubiquitin-RnfH superfamily antitoxin RatB of RatAB toxin-antitoxin module|nr:RnfH family protein [Oxalobacteraceae bacterium]
MAEATNLLQVQVCYATPEQQILLALSIPEGTSLQDAIVQSGILRQVREIDLDINRVGIYGRLRPLDTVLRAHDRVEIYRQLVADPKESRRKRAERKNDKTSRP